MTRDRLEMLADALSLADGYRADTTVTEQGSAALLLPVGPSAKQSKAITNELAAHAFRGRNTAACSKCGKPASDPIHRRAKVSPVAAAGARADVSEHPMAVKPVPPSQARVARNLSDKADFNADADQIEPQFRDAMTALFERQRAGTLSRLKGRRGQAMLKAAGYRADPPNEPPTSPSSTPVSPSSTPVSPSSTPIDVTPIFDAGFWATETAAKAAPTYANVTDLAARRVESQTTKAEPSEGSLASVHSIMQARANRMAQDVTDTTYRQIQSALSEGVQQGEGTQQLADRVSHVFDVAHSRASTIARTETIGALNEAALGYAKTTGAVARKRWLAHHDTRTRMAHRQADGQTVPLDAPFHVGGTAMQFPGDPSAPPDEVCNCRCSLAYLPATMAERTAS